MKARDTDRALTEAHAGVDTLRAQLAEAVAERERQFTQLIELRHVRNVLQTTTLEQQALIDALFREMKTLAVVTRDGPAQKEAKCWIEIERLFRERGYKPEDSRAEKK